MTAHRTVIEAGPGSIRRLCCGTSRVADAAATAALEGIDDPVTLLDEQPVAVRRLWRSVLRSLACPQPTAAPAVLVVHPTWWSAPRIELVTAAARTLAGDVVALPRAELLATAAAGTGIHVVVEITARLVAITGTVAVPRSGPPDRVAAQVVQRIAELTGGPADVVVVDAPDGVGGAAALAAMIAERLAGTPVAVIDATRLARLAAAAQSGQVEAPHPEPAGTGRARSGPALLAAAAVLAVLIVLGAGLPGRHRDAGQPGEAPTTFLVEGRVAVQVPMDWLVRRVTTGPGSARVEVISPHDPEVVLHVTQSPLPGPGSTGAAEALKDAITQANAAEPGEVFVDFDANGRSAGRDAVTYREVRARHHVDWTVLVDGAVRISIGCQSRPGAAEAVHAVCEQAVRSARALTTGPHIPGTDSAPTQSN